MTDWYDRWNRALKEQHQIIFDADTKSIRDQYSLVTGCPVCEQNDFFPWFEKDWFRWVRCRNCAMVYMHPRLTDDATHQFYNSEANSIYNASKFEEVSNTSIFDDQANATNLYMIDKLRNSVKGDLLEIGSGKGHFLKTAQDAGYQVYGVELNQKLCRYSQELLKNTTTILDVDLLDAKFPSSKFDVIYMRDLLQHIPNPIEFLQECARIAKPGCTIFIGTHNIDGFIARMVKSRYTPVFGFMEPSHYSPKSITALLDRTGFKVRDIQFESLDCTISEVINYFLSPTFTTIFPEKVSKTRRFLLRLLRAPLLIWPLRSIDRVALPHLANRLRLGSWMNVLAEKI
jgi:2-polyprenyl-3-methyl-5-hydroxy-6-metoxy-1,4-benzoquinol methylase